MPLRIRVACPAPPGSRQGNRITALRWARALRALGHRVEIDGAPGRPADLLIALHARRSAAAVRAFRARWPDRPLIVALTGTDLYRDLGRSRAAAASLALADRLIVLHPGAIAALPKAPGAKAHRAKAHRAKARVILQSAVAPRRLTAPAARTFDVCVLSHLRPVKDPLRAARAARRLPPASRLRIVHAGRALTAAAARQARAEAARNPRYRWLGELSHGAARALLARSRALVLSSRLEGGANVIGEAAVCGVPVLASRIAGSVGLLGADYPGFFPPGDTAALAALLSRLETDPTFRRTLQRRMHRLAPHFRPTRERAAWRRLLAELGAG